MRTSSDEGSVTLAVSDNGPGIPAEVRSRMFEPFFTTKDEGVGTGIGLALCHRIVEAHHGHLEVQTAAGAGATFVVRLPAAAPETAVSTAAEGRAAVAEPLTVLVVDDEPDVADVIAEILRHDGHRVVVELSGADALARVRAQEFDVILSDLRMPDLDGPSLYLALAEHDRAILERIGFVTGDTMSPKARSFLDSIACPRLEKPVTPATLRALVAELAQRRVR